VGDKVWDFVFGEGKVTALSTKYFIVNFIDYSSSDKEYFTYNGKNYEPVLSREYGNQSLFWSKIEFKDNGKPKIELKEKKCLVDLTQWVVYDENETLQKSDGALLSMFRDDINVAVKTLKHLTKHSRLLALRDQECSDSKGYEFVEGKNNHFIFFDSKGNKWDTDYYSYLNALNVYFKTKEDAQRVCGILNDGRFEL